MELEDVGMKKLYQQFIEMMQQLLDEIGQVTRALITFPEFEKRKNKKKRSSKMENFTQNARRILSLSQEATEKLGHNEIDVEHILLAMVRVEDCVANEVLADFQIAEVELLEQIKLLIPSHEQEPKKLDLAEFTKKSLNLSVDTARRLGHYYLGTGHLLIGILRLDKPQINSILAHFGTDAKTVIKHTKEIMEQKGDDDWKDSQ